MIKKEEKDQCKSCKKHKDLIVNAFPSLQNVMQK